MGAAWKYWLHVRLEASGRLRRQEIGAAKAFFQQQFPDLTEAPDLLVQRQLVQVMRSLPQLTELGLSTAQLAECCLRCFISHQIPEECASLERRFGGQGGFKREELLPYVLNDINPLQPVHLMPHKEGCKPYRPLAVKIVQRFDPAQSNLSTWTKRLVLQQKDLNAFLVECGIYLASNWAILSQTSVSRVCHSLSNILTAAEIQRVCSLLESYHQVYRSDRLQQRATQPGKRCEEPTDAQLQRMLQHLQTQGVEIDSAQQLLRELQGLAQQLRQLKQPTKITLDQKTTRQVDQQLYPSAGGQEQNQFLSRYRREAEQCLAQAVQQVLGNRLRYLQQQKPKGNQSMPKDRAFWLAMYLFHCEGKSMTEIAPRIGQQKQFQVSRLMDLKGLRADVRRWWLVLIYDQLPTLLEDYWDQKHLQYLDRLYQLDRLLDTLLETLAQHSGLPHLKSLRVEIRQIWLSRMHEQFFATLSPQQLQLDLSHDLLATLLQTCRAAGLKPLPDHLRQTLLQHIQTQLPLLLADFVAPQRLQFEQLQQFDQLLNQLLSEQIDPVIDQDATESYSPHRASRSIFSLCLCQQLKTWSTANDTFY